MKNEIIYDTNLHFEHSQWQSELAFWEDELKVFKNRLSELVTRWTAKEVTTKLEHYQNEFILHGAIIEDLREAIEKHEIRISGQRMIGENAQDRMLTQKHLEFRKKIEDQRQIYHKLKKEFFRFLTKYM